MLNTASISTLPESTNELYAQMLFVALQRLGLDAHSYLADRERAHAASKALSTLWLAVELAARADPTALTETRFERTRDLPSLPELRPLAKSLEPAALDQLAVLNGSGLLDVDPERWERLLPARGTDVMSTLALAWLAEAAVLGDELVVWLSSSIVLRRVIDALALLLEETLQGGPSMDVAPVPLSGSVIGEAERNALIDVWRAESNPATTSGIVAKPDKRVSSMPPAARARRGPSKAKAAWSPRAVALVAAFTLILLLVLRLWLTR
jgi:hypothetical protein